MTTVASNGVYCTVMNWQNWTSAWGWGSWKSHRICGNPAGWKLMLWGSCRGGKICRGTPTGMEKASAGFLQKCSCIWIFMCTAINVQISASAIHFYNMRQRMHNHFTIAIKIRAPMHHLQLTHKMGWKTSLRDGLGMEWELCGDGWRWNTNTARTKGKVDGDGWEWKLNQWHGWGWV